MEPRYHSLLGPSRMQTGLRHALPQVLIGSDSQLPNDLELPEAMMRQLQEVGTAAGYSLVAEVCGLDL